jgi:hypothetical protein
MDQPTPDEPINLDELIYLVDEPPVPSTGDASRTVSVHLTVQVGQHTKEFDVLATTDADGYVVARGLVGSLREEAADWTHAHQK